MSSQVSLRAVWTALFVGLALALALLLQPGTGRAWSSPYCGHGSMSYGGLTTIYGYGWTTAGTHYHQYSHTGGSEGFHYYTRACGGIGTRLSG